MSHSGTSRNRGQQPAGHAQGTGAGWRREGGFTLVELLVVIVILGILSAVVVFAVRGAGDKGQQAAVATDERTIRTALEVFCAKNSRYPGAGPWAGNPMGELFNGKYLSSPSEYHTLVTPGDPNNVPPSVEGNCPGAGPTTYQLGCSTQPCGSQGGGGPTTTPPGAPPAFTVAVGAYHSLALKRLGGTVTGWGMNGNGQTGYPSLTNKISEPVPVAGLAGVTSVGAGEFHSLAVNADTTVSAWGWNEAGQLGDGTKTSRAVPAPVKGLAGVTDVDGGQHHSLALRTDGIVMAWGRNDSGELGDGTTGDSEFSRLLPVAVKDLTGVTAVAAGQDHSMALKSNGNVWAWGRNTEGQVGGTNDKELVPVEVAGLTGVTAIEGGQRHSMALKSDGTVWAWGSAILGDGTADRRSLTPVKVKELTGVTAIAAGAYFSMALKSDGTVWAWGYNTQGELGIGSAGGGSKSLTPVQVTHPDDPTKFLTGVASIAAGVSHALAPKKDDTVWGWGDNGTGAVGDGTFTNRSSPVLTKAGSLCPRSPTVQQPGCVGP